jgi:hypothetical protein
MDMLELLIPKSVSKVKQHTPKPAAAKDTSWKSLSAPLPVLPADTAEECCPLDTRTTAFLLKFLHSRPLDSSTVTNWHTVFRLFTFAGIK